MERSDKDPEEFFRLVQYGDVEGVQRFVSQGYDVNTLNSRGFHPIHVTGFTGDLAMLRLLISLGASDVNVVDRDDNTGLHFASLDGNVDVAKELLDHGARLDAASEDIRCFVEGLPIPIYDTGGKTPLHSAAQGGSVACAQLLLERGAKRDALDFDGNTPYDLALLFRHADVAALLRPNPDAPTELPRDVVDHKLKTQRALQDYRIPNRIRQRTTAQRETSRRRRGYEPLHPELRQLSDDFVLPRVRDALAVGTPEALRGVLREDATGIYTFDMLSHDFCRKVIEEGENFEAKGYSAQRPNSMNNYGLVLDHIGYGSMLTSFMKKFIVPFAELLFPDNGGASLDSVYAFLVRYKHGEDLALATHVDDSDVTLNVCLGKEFSGGELFFYNSADGTEKGDKVAIAHRPGRAVLHVGKHSHGASPLQSGERINLIIWCRSSRIRKQ